MVYIFVIVKALFKVGCSDSGVPGSVFWTSAAPHSLSCVETILLPHPILITKDYTERRSAVHNLVGFCQ